MFAYCLNAPSSMGDSHGSNAEALDWWYRYMQWLTEADGPYPYGDAVFLLGVGVCIIITLFSSASSTDASAIPDIKASPVDTPETEIPEQVTGDNIPAVTYPGDDPTQAPKGTTWKGSGEQGSGKGNYHNPETGESWHPDLNHPGPIGPHWDYKDPSGNWWRIGTDNIPMPK